MGYRFTDDTQIKYQTIEGLKNKNGYCPCKVGKKEENKCPCEELILEENCKCGLFVKRRD